MKKNIQAVFRGMSYDIREHSKGVGKSAFLMLNEPGIMSELGFSDLKEFERAIFCGGQYHDLGKLMISNYILNKQTKLTDTEWEIIRHHPIRTSEIIAECLSPLKDGNLFYNTVMNMGAYHHEKYDGSGYPYELAGEKIPFVAQVTSIADVFDALVSKRSYKDQISVEKAAEIIFEGENKSFSPRAVECFRKRKDEIAEIYLKKR